MYDLLSTSYPKPLAVSNNEIASKTFVSKCVVCTRGAISFCDLYPEIDTSGEPRNVRWFCSPLCRELGRPTHKYHSVDMTSEEKLIERAKHAGEAVQALFYAFVEHTWAYDMSSIRIKTGRHDELVSIDVNHSSNQSSDPACSSICGRVADGWLVKFPQHAFDSDHKEVKCVLLADRHSVWAFVFLQVVVETLFEDLVDDVERDIKEVVHYLPDRVRRLVTHKDRNGRLYVNRVDLPYPDEDANGDLKGVYRITLKNGTKIALDLAGAQYNLLHKTVMPWSAYLNLWTHSIKYRLPFRSHYNKYVENVNNLDLDTHLTIITEQMACLNSLLLNCECLLGFNLKDLSTNDLELFHDHMHRLTTAVKECLEQSPHDLDAEPSSHSNDVLSTDEATHTKEMECIPVNFGHMENFDWSKLSKLIQMPSHMVTYKEKKAAKLLLKHRCVYKMPGDWRLVFNVDTLPSLGVPKECISENPYWPKKK